MKFSLFNFAVLALASSVVADTPARRYSGSLSARANHASLSRRQISIGGLVLGGNKDAAGAAEGQAASGGKGKGLTIGGLTLGGSGGGIAGTGLELKGGKGAQAAQNETERAGAKNETGNAEGAKAADEKPVRLPAEDVAAEPTPAAGSTQEEALSGAELAKESVVPSLKEGGAGAEGKNATSVGETITEAPAREEAAAGERAAAGEAAGTKAEEESERFSEDAGISLNTDGSTANLGGNLGITQGSDGSKSVGGENGINIKANGEAVIAGNERE